MKRLLPGAHPLGALAEKVGYSREARTATPSPTKPKRVPHSWQLHRHGWVIARQRDRAYTLLLCGPTTGCPTLSAHLAARVEF